LLPETEFVFRIMSLKNALQAAVALTSIPTSVKAPVLVPLTLMLTPISVSPLVEVTYPVIIRADAFSFTLPAKTWELTNNKASINIFSLLFGV